MSLHISCWWSEREGKDKCKETKCPKLLFAHIKSWFRQFQTNRGWINNFLKGTRPSDSGRTFLALRGVPVKDNQTFWPGVYCWAGAMCMFCWAALLSLNLSAVIVSVSNCFCWTGTIQWHNHREIQTWVYWMWARITGGQQVVSESVYYRYKLRRLGEHKDKWEVLC